MVTLLKKVNAAIVKLIDWLLIFLLSGMVLFIFLQVIYRYVLRQPLSWSEELARYFYSGITLFGAAALFRESKHINMSLFTDWLKTPLLKKALSLLSQCICLVFLVIVIWYGWPMSMMIIEFEVESPSMTWLKMGYVFMMLPVASILSVSMVLEVIITALQDFGAKKEEN